MTLSTLMSSSSRPKPPSKISAKGAPAILREEHSPLSMALENLTNTECFFMMRCICWPPMPMIRL